MSEKCIFCCQNPISLEPLEKSTDLFKFNLISVLKNVLKLSHEDLQEFVTDEDEDLDEKLCSSCHTNIMVLDSISREIKRLQIQLEETKRKMMEDRSRVKREEGDVEVKEEDEMEMEEEIQIEDNVDLHQVEFQEEYYEDDYDNKRLPAKRHCHGEGFIEVEELDEEVKEEIEEAIHFEDDVSPDGNEDCDDKLPAELPATNPAPPATTSHSSMATLSKRRGVVHLTNHKAPPRSSIRSKSTSSTNHVTRNNDDEEEDEDDSSSASEKEDEDNHDDQDKIMSQSSSLRKLSCPICLSPFSNFSGLQNFSCHLESCIANSVNTRITKHLQCPVCKVFKCPKDRSKHFLEHMLMCCESEGHSDSRPIPWRHCVVSCSSCRLNLLAFSDLAEHIYTYHLHGISCTRCPMRFKRSSECYRQHWNQHHKNLIDRIQIQDRWRKSKPPKIEPNIPWFCPVRGCYQMMESEEGRDQHVETKHANTPHRPLKKFKCFMCGNTYYTREELRIHHVTIHQILLKKPPVKCDIEGCTQLCLTKKELEDHKRASHGINLFTCSTCGEGYRKNETLQKHISKMHWTSTKEETKVEKASCPICHKLLNPVYLQTHMETVHGNREKLKCDECDAEFLSTGVLEKHMQRMHVDSKRIYACPREGCTKICKTHYLLDIHLARVHDKKFLEFCKECGKGFYMKGPRIQHEKTHLSEDDKIVILHPCPTCKKEFKFKRCLQKHLRSCTPESLKCGLCDIQLASFDELRQHKKKEHWQYFNRGKELTISCSVCNQVFNNRSKYSGHMRVAHVRKLCEICGVRLHPFPYSVNWHMAKKHGIGDFKCDEENCTEVFCNEMQLHRHKASVHKLQTELEVVKPKKMETPSSCDICGKTYGTKARLRQHIRLHHEKKFTIKCDMCGKGVKDNRDLKRHKSAAHDIREFKCNSEGCTKEFYCQKRLTEHQKFTHEGQVRPRDKFCQFCGKAYSSTELLRLHEQAMHTNRESKPFKCNLCGKTFATDRYLDYHIRGTHKIKRVKDVKNKC